MTDQTALTRPTAGAVMKPQDEMKSLLESRSFLEALARVTPKHLTAERLAKMAILAATKTPKLLNCMKSVEGKMSMLKAVMDAGTYGLDCSGLGGRGYIVPFDDRKKGVTLAQFIPGYRGLMDVARNTGMVTNIWAEVVYASDEFSFDKGENTLHHVEKEGDRSDRSIIGAYARAKIRGSDTPETRYVNRAEIERHRAKSKAGSSGPWTTDYAAMCRKTALLVLCRDLPQSSEMISLTEHDREVEEITTFNVHEPVDPNAGLVAKLVGPPEDEQEPAPDPEAVVGAVTEADRPEQAPTSLFDPIVCQEQKCKNVVDDNGEVKPLGDCEQFAACKMRKK